MNIEAFVSQRFSRQKAMPGSRAKQQHFQIPGHDRIAGASISYGGRGQITDVQQPRYGQQIADIVLPY